MQVSNVRVHAAAAPRTARKSPLVRVFIPAAAVLICVAFGQIGKDLLYNPFRTGIQEDRYGLLYGYFRYAIVMLTFLLGLANNQASLSRVMKVLSPFFPYMLIIVASLTWSEDVEVTSRYIIITIGLFFALCMVAVNIGPVQHLRYLTLFLIGTAIASTLMAILVPSIGVHQSSDAIEAVHAGRWRGIFNHKNTLGPYMGYALIFMLCLRKQLPISRLYYGIGLFCALLCFLMSFSGNAIVGFSVAMLTFVILNSKLANNKVFVVVAFLVVALLVAAGPSLGILDLMGKDATFSGRTLIWEVVLQNWQDAPLLGHGYMASISWLAPILQARLFGSAVDAHNGFLQFLVDIGAIGLASLMIPMFLVLWRGYLLATRVAGDERRMAVTLVACMVCALIMSFGEVTPLRTVSDGYITYIVTIILAVMINQNRQQVAGARARATHSRTARSASLEPRGLVGAAHPRTSV